MTPIGPHATASRCRAIPRAISVPEALIGQAGSVPVRQPDTFLQDKTAAAIGAIDLAFLAQRQVDQGMTQGTAAAVAANGFGFDVDCFGRLHA